MVYYSALHYASKAEKSATSAANSATQSANSAELSRLYANDKINQTHITNCITEIPQDIKLELKDGTLTLKAGSKVYVPNGFEADGVTPKFDEVITESDIIDSGVSFNGECYILYNVKDNLLGVRSVNHVASGTTQPTDGSISIWYDTANNIIKEKLSGVWIENQLCLPLAMVRLQTETPYITSIDQVFNGFGYIGSTVFALPNVKGLIPNGRNEDGSLKNIEFVNDKVLINTKQSDWTQTQVQLISQNTLDGVADYDYDYNKERNVIVYKHTGIDQTVCAWGSAVISLGRITSLTPKLPFRAVDYSDSSWIAAQSMPSSRYIDLILGASGSTYTAPANGWVQLSQQASSSNTSVSLVNTSAGELQTTSKSTSGTNDTYIPVKAHDTFRAFYIGSITKFRFIYAEGEN